MLKNRQIQERYIQNTCGHETIKQGYKMTSPWVQNDYTLGMNLPNCWVRNDQTRLGTKREWYGLTII